MLTRRGLLTTGAALAGAGVALHTRQSRAANNALTIGYIADFPNASVLAIADDQKLWQKAGLKAEAKVFTNGPIQIQAMGAGSLNFGTIGPGALWLPASGRCKVVAVNDIGFSDRVIAQPNITSMQDLRGRKVGVPQGTSGDMILRLGLAKAGMTINDIQMLPMDPSTIVAAFASKQIAAAGIWYPLIDVIKKRVPDLKELVNDQEFYPDTSFINTFIARNEIVQQDPDVVQGFVHVMKQAMDYRVANLDRSITLTIAYLSVPADAVRNNALTRKMLTSAQLDAFTKDGTVDKWLTQFNTMFQQFGQVKDPLPAKEYYTADLFLKA